MARKHIRAFQAMCHEKVTQGLINQADGNWKPAATTPTTNEHHMLAGYRLTGAKAGKKKGRQSKD